MHKKITRRDFLKGIGALVAITTMAATLPPQTKRTHITFTRAPEFSKATSRAWQMHLKAVKATAYPSFASFEAGAGRMTDPLWETPMRHPETQIDPFYGMGDAGDIRVLSELLPKMRKA